MPGPFSRGNVGRRGTQIGRIYLLDLHRYAYGGHRFPLVT